MTSSPVVRISDGSWEQDKSNRRAFVVPDRSTGGVLAETDTGLYEKIKADVVFPILHGKNGEDAQCRGFFRWPAFPL